MKHLLLEELNDVLHDEAEGVAPLLDTDAIYDLLARCQVEIKNNYLKIATFRSRHMADIDDLNKLRSIIKKRIY